MSNPIIRKASCNHPLAFTLIELMVALSVVAILASIAAPSMADLIRRNKLTSTTNEFVSAVSYARSESILRGNQVMLCSSTDISATTPACAAEGSWTSGWIVFVDTNNNSAIDSGESILRVWPSTLSDLTLSPPSTNARGLSFGRTGKTEGISASGDRTLSGSMTICANNLSEGRTTHVNQTGRVSTARTTSCLSS